MIMGYGLADMGDFSKKENSRVGTEWVVTNIEESLRNHCEDIGLIGLESVSVERFGATPYSRDHK